MAKDESIPEILQSLHSKHDNVLGCMLTDSSLMGYVAFPEDFKESLVGRWDVIKKTLKEVMGSIPDYYATGMNELNIDLLGLYILLFVLEGSNTALIAFIKHSDKKEYIENLDEIWASMQDARTEITNLIEKH